MADNKRKIGIMKQGKKYVGSVIIPSDAFRTIDYFNRPALMRHRDNLTTLDNYIQMHDVAMIIDGKVILKKQGAMNILVTDIIFYWDDLENIGDSSEQKRARTLMDNTGRTDLNSANIITPMFDNQFFQITGTFHGNFKSAMMHNFLALTNTSVNQIYIKPETGKWCKKPIDLPHGFLALNMNHIDSYSLKDDE
jgi:hypothetical protein